VLAQLVRNVRIARAQAAAAAAVCEDHDAGGLARYVEIAVQHVGADRNVELRQHDSVSDGGQTWTRKWFTAIALTVSQRTAGQ
jgi:hypothetical protein